ncbi:MAG TPA: hypothetical protein VGW39_04010 [Chthoniobacterales bacterium]|nr:hypothetical protein [Chthoniobacterales bacterium]
MLQDGNRLVVFGSQIIGVLIVVVGLLTQHAELHSPRPVGSKMQVTEESGQKGDRFARLWDDPLEDLPAFQVAGPKDAPLTRADKPPKQAAASLDESSPPNADQSTASVPASDQPQADQGIFLWNILDARPLPEVRERRLRIRYAIVSALVAAGYLPLRDSSLSPLVRTVGPPASPKKELFGYFETFEAKDAPFQRVCLIWTPKQSTALPIEKDVLTDIKTQIHRKGDLRDSAQFRVLHHGNSEDLITYLDGLNLPEDIELNHHISFMRATFPSKSLPGDARRLIHFPILTDDFLVEALVHELSLRIPQLNRDKGISRIIIFTESDTKYSRTIASEFADKLKGRARLEVYSYLRGLDGRPEELRIPAKAESTTSNDPAKSLLQGRAISENSFGTSQFDYLRRLALSLGEERRKKRDCDIAAVGILGSDIYDKMLVLQAIRPELPAAVFFTTDLDALYLERENQTFTRNLVIASADGLDMNGKKNPNDRKWKLPPMRDSYQTILAKRIWAILASSERELDVSTRASSPRLFEIVAGKSVDLNPAKESFAAKASGLLGRLPELATFIFVLALLNGFVILWAISTRTGKTDAPNKVCAPMTRRARIFVYTEMGLACAGLLFLLYMLSWSHASLLFGEPLSLGASIWPSVMIRLLAFLVAVLLLLIASYTFVARGARLKEDIKAALPDDVQVRVAESLGQEAVSGCRFLFSEQHTPCREKPFAPILEKLFDQTARRKRIMLASGIYLALSFILFAKWPPVVPARGPAPFLIDKVVVALGVALYVIHLIYCLDLHLSARSLLRNLHSFCFRADVEIKGSELLTAVSELTAIIGKTLLYPLTVLILIILSRLQIFDVWIMTPSLTITFSVGAALLVTAALILWREGVRLKGAVLATEGTKPQMEATEKEKVGLINEGVFAAWHHQPIFAAIFSVVAVFGSLSIAGPLARLLFGSS